LHTAHLWLPLALRTVRQILTGYTIQNARSANLGHFAADFWNL